MGSRSNKPRRRLIPLHWVHPVFTQPDGSLLALGIGPVLLSEIVMQILVADINAETEARTFQQVLILLSIN